MLEGDRREGRGRLGEGGGGMAGREGGGQGGGVDMGISLELMKLKKKRGGGRGNNTHTMSLQYSNITNKLFTETTNLICSCPGVTHCIYSARIPHEQKNIKINQKQNCYNVPII